MEIAPTFDAKAAPSNDRLFRSVLGHFSSGVAIITATSQGAPVGMTIQSFSSLSLRPPLVLLCVAGTSTSWPRIRAAGRLCVNILAADQEPLASQFARSGGEKFAGVDWTPSPVTGSPQLVGSLAWLDCSVGSAYPGGDHLIVVCPVLALGADADKKPLVFFRGEFRSTRDREQ
jgi:3-hydroxy-9,10-secoandrosta-1,3,5(10)-triene-9,17-dione monooxygenase reductase component